MNANALLAPPTVGLLPENATAPIAHQDMNGFDRESNGIVENYNKPAGTVYGQSREAELTDVEQALIRPANAVGALAVGRYSVGPKQSDAAKVRIAEHERWVNSDKRRLALGEMLAMQAIVEAQAYKQIQEQAAKWIAEWLGRNEDDEDGESEGKSKKRSKAKKSRISFSLAA